MTGLLGFALPPWLNPTVLGAVAIGIAGATAGAYIDHRLMSGRVDRAHLETATIQSSLDGYRASVAAASAKATATALAERISLQGQLDALQAKLDDQQRKANAKSAELLKLLSDAKTADARPLGPTALEYFSRLRGP